MTEKSKTRDPKEIKEMVAISRRDKLQQSKYLELRKQELDVILELRKFESSNNKLNDDGKPSYAMMQEYHDLVDKYKDVQLRYKEIELNDSIKQLEERIAGTEKMIAELERGIVDSVVEKVVEEEESKND